MLSSPTIRRLMIPLSLVLAALVPSLAAAQQGARQISLDDAVRLAVRNSPQTIQARNATHVGRVGVLNAAAQFLPNFGVGAGASQQGGATFFQGKLVPYTGDPWSYGKGYSANLMLFDAGQRWFNYRTAQANLRSSSENESVASYNVILNVKQQYFAVLAAREAGSAAQRQLEQAQQQLDVTAAKARIGAVSRSDSLRSAIAVGSAKLAILTAQGQLRTANATLTRLAESPFEITALASDTSQVPRLELDSAAVESLVSQAPSVRQAEAAFDANRAAQRAAMTPYLPTLSVGYGFTTSNTSQTFSWGGGPASSSTRLTFSLNWTLFNNFQRELNLATANAAEDNADAALRDARLAARVNLEQYLGAFRTAEQSVELQQLQIAAAEEDLRGQQEKYRLGASSLLDVLTSQAALDNARSALIAARFQARTAKAQIEALIGHELR